MDENDIKDLKIEECRHRLDAVQNAMFLVSHAQIALPTTYKDGRPTRYGDVAAEEFAALARKLNQIHWRIKQEMAILEAPTRATSD